MSDLDNNASDIRLLAQANCAPDIRPIALIAENGTAGPYTVEDQGRRISLAGKLRPALAAARRIFPGRPIALHARIKDTGATRLIMRL